MEQKVKESIYKNLNIGQYTIVINKRGEKPPICFGEVVDALFTYGTGPKAIKSLGRSEQTFNRLVKRLFPEVKLQGGEGTWVSWLVRQSDYKKCSGCSEFSLRETFTKSALEHDGIDRYCTDCKSSYNKNNYQNNKEYHQEYWKIHGREKNARRGAQLKQALAPWADIKKLKEIYNECPEGYHVDHIYPFNAKNSCGLHIENNLQYLTVEENLKKSNKVPNW